MTERSEVKAAASGPPNARTVLVSLILVAAVANLNLSVANVALPDIGRSFDSSQTCSTSSRSVTRLALPRQCSGSGHWATGTGGSC